MIRPLNEKDLDSFIEIRMEGLQKEPTAFGAAYEEGINKDKTFQDLKNKNEENFILGYFDQEQLIGIIGLVRYHRLKMNHKAFIWGMYVKASHRGKGIGRQLMEQTIEKAKQIPSLQKINLSVIDTQVTALQLYQRLGFEIFGKDQHALCVDGQFYDEILLSKVLS